MQNRHLTPKIKPYFVNYLRDTTLGLISYALTLLRLSLEIRLFYIINGQSQAVLFFNFLSEPGGAVIIPWPANALVNGCRQPFGCQPGTSYGFGPQPTAKHFFGPVILIENVGYDDLRHAGQGGSGRGSGAAVVHDGGQAGKQQWVRDLVDKNAISRIPNPGCIKPKTG